MVCEVASLITVRSLARSYANPRVQIRTLKQQIATSEMMGWSICAAEILNCACPKWVKNGKTQLEQILSAVPPIADIVGEAVRLRGMPHSIAFILRIPCATDDQFFKSRANRGR